MFWIEEDKSMDTSTGTGTSTEEPTGDQAKVMHETVHDPRSDDTSMPSGGGARRKVKVTGTQVNKLLTFR